MMSADFHFGTRLKNTCSEVKIGRNCISEHDFKALIEAGFKGLHPVESQAGMGLEELNEKRNNMVFLGNFQLDLLRFKEMEDLRPILARKLDFAKDKGGYVFGFESPITPDIDLGKYQKVIEFVKEY